MRAFEQQNAAAAMCAPLVDVLAHGQPVLAQYATEALAELARTNSLLPAGTLSHTLGRVLKVPYDKKDAGLVLALQGLVQQVHPSPCSLLYAYNSCWVA